MVDVGIYDGQRLLACAAENIRGAARRGVQDLSEDHQPTSFCYASFMVCLSVAENTALSALCLTRGATVHTIDYGAAVPSRSGRSTGKPAATHSG